MGLKDRNNPLGQRIPSDKVGGSTHRLKHEQSAELVEQIKRKARRDQGKGKNLAKQNATDEYDVTGPDRQPGKVSRQSELGKKPRQPQHGQYTQDNEEEGPLV